MGSSMITNPSFGWWGHNCSLEGENRDWAMIHAVGCYSSNRKKSIKLPKLKSGQIWTLNDGRVITLLTKINKRWLVQPRGVENPDDFLLIPIKKIMEERYFLHCEETSQARIFNILDKVHLA